MKLSVVTPSLNQAAFLGETLESVRLAAERVVGRHEVEHLVRDGGSTDGSTDILAQQTFARWISERDGGQSDAVNRGWNAASGDVLSFLCSDDLWLPDTADRVLTAFEAAPALDVVYGDAYFLEGDSGWRRLKRSGPFSVERLRAHNFLSQPATFIHRRVYERFGGLDAGLRFCMDHEYWLRIARQTRWHYLEAPLAVMRLHSDSKTSSQLTKAWWETAEMAKRHGLGNRFWWAALRMQCGGQWYYALKRRYFAWVGRRR